MTKQINQTNPLLNLNVGHLLSEGVGTIRTITLDEQHLRIDDVDLDSLRGSLDLTRTAQGILVRGQLAAQISSECVRCLTAINITFNVDLSSHFIYPPSAETGDDEFNISDSGKIDLTPLVREDAILAMPIHAVCKVDCRGLCSHCGKNLNETTCDYEHSSIDPRFESLKALLDE